MKQFKITNKIIAFSMATSLLAGCVTQQPSVRRDVPTPSVKSPSSESLQQAAPAQAIRMQPAVSQTALPETKKSASISPQTQAAIEARILCLVPLGVEPLQAKLRKESVIIGQAISNGSGTDYRAASQLAVFGLPVTFVTFAGNDESDWAEAGVMVTGNSQPVMKALSTKHLPWKKDPASGGLMAKGKNGVARISQMKKGTYISCSRGWD
jgi:hypothetical protein